MGEKIHEKASSHFSLDNMCKHSLTYMKQFFFGVLETAGPNIATMQLSQVITALKTSEMTPCLWL